MGCACGNTSISIPGGLGEFKPYDLFVEMAAGIIIILSTAIRVVCCRALGWH